MRTLQLRSQSDLLTDIRADVEDASKKRWTSDTDVYRAINTAIESWSDRVLLPRLYALPGGFSAGVYEYAIPDYVGHNFVPQIEVSALTYLGYPVQITDSLTRDELAGWSVEPTVDGTRILRTQSTPHTDSGWLLWYAPNGPVPTTTTLPVLGAECAGTATTATISTALADSVPDVGWVKMGGEWVSYAGLTRGATTTTLLNLVRGLYNTVAATHAATTTTVYWGVGVDDSRLWDNLRKRAIAELHLMLLHRGTTDDRQNHEKLYLTLTQQADQFWRRSGYVSGRKPRFKLASRWT